MRLLSKKLSTILLVLIALACCPRAEAEEPVSEFLDGLRERKFFDVAMEYLDSLQDSDLVSPAMKILLPYERAKTLIQSATHERDYDVGERRLDDAQKILQKFISEQSQHPLLESANAELGNLLQRRANVKVQRSKKNVAPSAKAKLTKEAQDLYDEGYKVFKGATERLREKVKEDTKQGFIDRKKQPAAYRVREELRKSFLQAQILGAAILEEKADTYDKGSADYNKSLESAATHYEEIYTAYRTRMAGLLAQLYLGRTHQKLRQFKDAVSYLNELLDQPKNDVLRPLKTEALQLAMECWLDDSEKKYAEAVNRGSAWVNGMRPNERNETDWIKLRLTLARAHKLYAEYLEKEKPKDPQIRRSQKEARSIATAITRIDGPFRREAGGLLAELPGGNKIAVVQETDPQDFKEAKKAGSDALEALKSAQFVLDNVPQRIASESDPAEKQRLEQELAAAKEKIANGRAVAGRYFQMALDFSGPQTPLEDVNLCRYFLAYIRFLEKNYYDAAVIGEFVAQRYSDSASARQCANIAMACQVQIYIENQGQPDRSFEAEQIINICKLIADRWKGEPETADAVIRLVPFLLNAKRIDEAEKYLVQIPTEAPERADAELRTGQSIWRSHRLAKRELRKAEDAGNIGDPEKQAALKNMASLKKRAKALLSTGLDRVKANPEVNSVLVYALLSLAQIRVEDRNYEEVLSLLEDKKVGLLPLVRQDHEAVSGKGVASEVYKLALRSYISLLPTSQTPQAVIKKASAIMDGLKKSVSNDEAGQRQLVAIYYGLARDLEDLIKSSKSDAERKVLSSGFEKFVNEVGRGSSEFNVLQWVAETFMGLGKGFDGGKTTSPEAVKYYGMAAETFERILAAAEKDPMWISDNAKLQVQWRLANAKRASGEYKDAMNLFARVLVKRNTMLDVQMEAAKTYQEWARQSPGYYKKAIFGGYYSKKRRKNLIWGWDTLARVAFRDPQRRYMDTFWESRLNQYQCRYEYALTRNTKADKEEQLKNVKKSFRALLQLTPDLKNWHNRFDALYRKVQNSLGEDPVGLPKPGTATGG